MERFKAGEDVVDDVLVMLQRWLIGHIKNEDGDYIDIVSAHMDEINKGRGGWLSRTLGKFFK